MKHEPPWTTYSGPFLTDKKLRRHEHNPNITSPHEETLFPLKSENLVVKNFNLNLIIHNWEEEDKPGDVVIMTMFKKGKGSCRDSHHQDPAPPLLPMVKVLLPKYPSQPYLSRNIANIMLTK